MGLKVDTAFHAAGLDRGRALTDQLTSSKLSKEGVV